MASNYPTSKDTFLQPTDPSTAALSSAGAGGNTRPHLEHHRDLGDVLEAVQDRLGYGPVPPYGSGFVASLWNYPEGPAGNHTPTLNRLELRRYDIFPSGQTITQLGFYLITAVASSFYRPVIYSDDGTGCYPASLLVDGGQVDTSTGAASIKATTAFTAQDMTSPKWVGGVLQGAAAISVQGFNAAGRGMAIASLGSNVHPAAYYQDSVTGAPPSTFTATRNVQGGACRILYK